MAIGHKGSSIHVSRDLDHGSVPCGVNQDEIVRDDFLQGIDIQVTSGVSVVLDLPCLCSLQVMAVVPSETAFQVGLKAKHETHGVLGLQPLQVDLQLGAPRIDLPAGDPLRPLREAAEERRLPKPAEGGGGQAD